MTALAFALICFVSFGPTALGLQTDVRYVDVSLPATGVHDGAMWSTAYRDLTQALEEAAIDPSVKEVWVAKGIYTPDATRLANPKMATFLMPERDFKLVGGFVNGMTSPSQRYIGDFKRTILDGSLSDISRCYNVVRVPAAAVAGNPIPLTKFWIDGFVVRNGFARGAPGSVLGDHTRNGGGIHCAGASLRIENCTMVGNYAYECGGGVYFSGQWKDAGGIVVNRGFLSILACEFVGNLAASAGGGLYMEQWATFSLLPGHVFSTRFHRNLAGILSYASGNGCPVQGGGAIAIGPREPLAHAAFQNNVFSGNIARGWGSAVWSLSTYAGGSSSNGSFDWSNCTFTSNAIINSPVCNLGGPWTVHETGTVVMDGAGTMRNSIFWNNHGVSQNGLLPETRDGVKPDGLANWQHLNCNIETYASGSLPVPFGNISQDPLFTDPGRHDYTLQALSPCIDVGSSDLILLDYPDGNNSTTVGPVLYEFNLALPRVVDFLPSQSCTPGPNTCGEVDMGAFERQSAP